MEKSLCVSKNLPFYVFKQNLSFEEDWEKIRESVVDIAEAAKEPSWYEFWLTQGNDIVLNSWKITYKDYIDETACQSESKKEQLKDESGIEEYSAILDDLQESTNTWEVLWNEHNRLIYYEEYNKFVQIYDNYYWNLKEAFKEEKNDKDEKFVDFAEIEAEIEQLKLAGLPTAFASSKNSLNTKRERKKPIEKIEYLETSDSEYTLSEESNEFESEIEVESEIEMPPIKKTIPKAEESDEFKNLHTIQNKTILKSKPKINRALRKAPDFMLQEKSMLKYWRQRFILFSRFDEGIKLDRESWFSVTPEIVAAHMAKRMACNVVIDGFCGSGGNAIQFAMTCNKVIAIDIDADKVEMARHNAGIYGVADKIEFIVGDFLSICESGTLKGDVIFLSPPWGGPKYNKQDEYDIESALEPVSASKLMEMSRKLSTNIALFLPRNSKIKQIIQLAGSGNKCEIEHNYLGERVVGLTAYYGKYFSL